MINTNTYEQRFENAQAQKNSSKYADRLKAELTKPEWARELLEISADVLNVTNKKGYEDYENRLKDLFDKIFDIITAPGLDDFMEWLESMSKKTDNQELRKFFASNYVTYGNTIDKIIEAKDKYISDNDTLFNNLISVFDKKLRKKINNFVSNKDGFEKVADGFLSSTLEELNGINAIEALAYHNQEELYSDVQKNDPSMNFYADIIKGIINSCQNAFSDEEVKDGKFYEVVSNRVSKAQSSIKLLYNTNIANEPDEVLKKTFTRYRKKMTDTSEDIYAHLKNFLENQWKDISSNYCTIKTFFDQNELDFEKERWAQFEKSAELDALVREYNNLKGTSILPTLENIAVEKLADELNKQADNIEKLNKKAIDCRKDLNSYFQNFVNDYTNNKRPMLDKLLAKNTSLKNNYDEIFNDNGYLKIISNGIEIYLSDGGDVLNALSDSTSGVETMIVFMDKAKTAFANVFKDSGLKEEIEWLDKLNPDIPFTTETFDEDKLKKLLKNELITISFTKTY